MNRTTQLLIGAASALAIAVLPLKLELAAFGSFEPASAWPRTVMVATAMAAAVAMAAETVTRASTASRATRAEAASRATRADTANRATRRTRQVRLRPRIEPAEDDLRSGDARWEERKDQIRKSIEIDGNQVPIFDRQVFEEGIHEIEVAALPDEAPILEDKPTGNFTHGWRV